MATGVRDGDRRDRGSSRWEFINHRRIQIGIGGHRQGARNRGGGHDQLMRVEALLLAFFPQCQALMNAKTVLFIDDHQRQAVKLHLFLEDSVGADNHLHLTTGNGLLLRLTGLAFLLAR